MSIDHLIFDTTDFETIDDTHSVGAYVRSGESGALVTHHTPVEAGSVSFDFVDGDVTVGTDTINEVGHGLFTGEVVQLSTTGTLPAGLSPATDYYVIRVDADNFKLAASAKDAERGDAVDITAAAGGGTHTVTEQDRDRRALDVWMMNEIDVNLTQDDEITVFQGTSPWVIGDGGGSITVDAVDLDIRDLVHTQDSVAIGDGTDLLDINADGSINITDNGGSLTIDNAELVSIDSTLTALSKAEDAAHVSGDQGIQALSVRVDDLDSPPGNALADTEGDYQSLHTTARGALWVTHDGEAEVSDAALANTAIASSANALDVADTAEDVVASPLADRKYLFIYNNGNKKAYIGESGVSEADGFPLSPGSYLELRAGAAIDIEWVSKNTNQEIRTLELS